MMLIADILERAKSTDPDTIVEAIKKTNYMNGLMLYAGPVVFNEIGDNPNAVTTMVQILGQKPVAVWP
jgi:ABC-type branched-subunit amino acid transport system substrate-binding protein